MFKNILRLSLSIGLSFAIIALLLQMVNAGVPDADRPSVFSALKNTSFILVFGYLVLYLFTTWVRAYRYRLLIQLSGEQAVPTIKQMLLVTGVRNMVVDMLPARVGELGYVALLNRGYGVKLEHCVSSLTISIAFDFVALVVVALAIVGSQLIGVGVQGWAVGALLMAVIVSVIAMVGLFAITPWFTSLLTTKLSSASASASASAERPVFAKVLELLNKFSDSVVLVRDSGRTMKVLVISVFIRVLKYLGFFMLFQAVAIPNFESLASLPTTHILGALIGGEVGASMPIPTFMSFGAYEAGGILVFQLLGVADQAAAAVALLGTHIWSQAVEYTIGGLLLALFVWINRSGKRAEVIAEAAGSTRRARAIALASFLGAGSVLALGTGFLAYQVWAASKLGAITAPDSGGVADNVDEWRKLSKEHVSKVGGFVVFGSNRDGNHDIFRLKLDTFELDKLTTHPNTETYPRISPDGKRVVFSRAHQVWVSLRNTVAWDVFVLDLATMQEKQVGSNATAPRWLNNNEVTFLKDATKVQKVNVDTGASAVIFEGGVNTKIPAGSPLQNPSVNPSTMSVAFTAKQRHIGTNTGHWGTAVTDGIAGAEHRGVMNGCELAWASDGSYMYQVNPDAESLRIMRVDPETLASSIMVDLEGEFSHEYWPKDSFNGQYMVFGASRGPKDHEHDTKDYEIFLWKIGSDKAKATRLTFHTGNDNWPDVFIP